ncbi:MAG: hypothetical protein AABX01_02765 [Candidatus Micrarchaeota archaeon]
MEIKERPIHRALSILEKHGLDVARLVPHKGETLSTITVGPGKTSAEILLPSKGAKLYRFDSGAISLQDVERLQKSFGRMELRVDYSATGPVISGKVADELARLKDRMDYVSEKEFVGPIGKRIGRAIINRLPKQSSKGAKEGDRKIDFLAQVEKSHNFSTRNAFADFIHSLRHVADADHKGFVDGSIAGEIKGRGLIGSPANLARIQAYVNPDSIHIFYEDPRVHGKEIGVRIARNGIDHYGEFVVPKTLSERRAVAAFRRVVTPALQEKLYAAIGGKGRPIPKVTPRATLEKSIVTRMD